MFKRILVPLDGSGFGEAALPYALAIVTDTAGRLQLFSAQQPILPPAAPGGELAGHVFVDPPADPSLGATHDLQRSAREDRESYLRAAADRVREATGIDAEVAVVDGDASDAIEARVAEWDADLVVMSTHGRGALERAWLGSVADRLVRRLDRSILLVRPQEDEADTPAELGMEPSLRRVVITLDGSEVAEGAIGPATRLASTLQAPVALLSVIGGHFELGSAYIPHAAHDHSETMAEERREAEEYLARIARRMSDEGVAVAGWEVREGPAARTILDAVDPAAGDILAMATHGRGGLKRLLLGSVSDKVLRGATVPLLLVRPRRE